jgi:DNA polymerase-4
MPAVRAERLCPEAIFVAPDFTRYRAVSRQGRELFKRHTDLIEPLALDEAYLDVTQNKTGLLVARAIREQIREELNLTASAGVAPNKFLAKLASDWRKADGLSVSSSLRTSMRFYHRCRLGACLESAKSPGEKLGKLGIQTLRDLRSLDLPVLEHHFGRCGQRLYELARGIDDSEVVPDRPTQLIRRGYF